MSSTEFDHDFFYRGRAADQILVPQSVDEAYRQLRKALAEGECLVARGGGMSYTGGYIINDSRRSSLVDLRQLTGIDIDNLEDGWVVVDAGVTWEALRAALLPLGRRSTFGGPLSGLKSTVGGGISQNAAFWGSGRTGSAAEGTLGLEVLLADGSSLRTGVLSRGHSGRARYFGPDFTGLFVGDCGRFGIKLRIALAVEPLPAISDSASFSFDSADALLKTMTRVAKQRLVAQQVGFDPLLANLRARRSSFAEDFRTLSRVLRGSGTLLKGLRNATEISLAGRSFLEDAGFSLHVMCEADDPTGVAAKLAHIRAFAAEVGAKEIDNSVPKIMLAAPFTPLNGILGPNGERWVPVHGLFTHSNAAAAYGDYLDVLRTHESALQHFGITSAALFSAVGAETILMEPMFFWEDSLEPLHYSTLEEKVRKRIPVNPDNEAARQQVATLRKAVIDAWGPRGAGHFQVGRAYPYADRLDPAQRQLLDGWLAAIDPERRMNPGVLGL